MPAWEPQVNPRASLLAACKSAARYSAVESLQVYDVVLDAALHTQKCGPRKLLVSGEWEWLLNGFAGDLLAAAMPCAQPMHRHSLLQSAACLLEYVWCCICLQQISFTNHMFTLVQGTPSDGACLHRFSRSVPSLLRVFVAVLHSLVAILSGLLNAATEYKSAYPSSLLLQTSTASGRHTLYLLTCDGQSSRKTQQ